MSLDADILVDRRRLKRRLGVWRLVALVLAVALAVFAVLQSQEISQALLGGPHIARVKISGIIRDDREQLELLEKIGKSDQVAAVILSINSPGGTTIGGEALYDGIAKLAEKKPVVAVMSTIGTSAAYLVALASDRIFARMNTITGSVGVIFQWAEVSELLKTLGVKVEEIKSGILKANPSPFEPIDEEGRRVAEQMVNEAKTWFVALVAKERGIDPQTVPGLTEGRVYSGQMAVDNKLIDAIGGETAAVTWLEETKGIPSGLKIVDWKEKDEGSLGVLGLLTGAAGRLIGLDPQAVAGLMESSRIGSAQLDGLVSLWHPSLE